MGTRAPAGTGPHDSGPPRLRLWQRLSFRLFVFLCLATAALLAVHTGLLVREETRQLMGAILLSADRVSDVIQRTTRTAMLRNQRRELHEMIENIGEQEGIEGVRVFNKQGDIMFSTDPVEIGTRVDLEAEACYRCHRPGAPLPATLHRDDRARIFAASDGHRILGVIRPIPNAPDCSTAECHAHTPEQTMLGVLDVRMSLAQVDAQLAGTRRRMLLASIALALAVATSFALLILRLVQVPVAQLTAATRAVTSGVLDRRLDVRSGGDLGHLAHSFNVMTEALERAETENQRWAATLEDKVEQKTAELQRAQAHLVQMDRMASLGRLAATVAHEINNPLSGILTYARLLERDLEREGAADAARAGSRRMLATIGSEARRCGTIAQSLLQFARTSGTQMVVAHVHELVGASLGLVQHHLDLNNVHVVRRFAPGDDMARCAPGEIQQALLALLVNAAEAMPAGGKLEVGTDFPPDGSARIAVRDEGVGIPPEIQSRIFEPFFTTKTETNGVGLGLAIVYGIMQRHGGRVEVASQPEAGSTFTLVWPRLGAPEAAGTAAPGAAGPPGPGSGGCTV